MVINWSRDTKQSGGDQNSEAGKTHPVPHAAGVWHNNSSTSPACCTEKQNSLLCATRRRRVVCHTPPACDTDSALKSAESGREKWDLTLSPSFLPSPFLLCPFSLLGQGENSPQIIIFHPNSHQQASPTSFHQIGARNSWSSSLSLSHFRPW